MKIENTQNNKINQKTIEQNQTQNHNQTSTNSDCKFSNELKNLENSQATKEVKETKKTKEVKGKNKSEKEYSIKTSDNKTNDIKINNPTIMDKEKKQVLEEKANINRLEKQILNIKNNEEVEKAINGLSNIVKELSQSDEKNKNTIKKPEISTVTDNMINNDYNIQDKDLLPQMHPNMNFSGDGQPFSSFMNNETKSEKQKTSLLGNSTQDLAEEAAILSTMAENISIANRNLALQQPNEVEVIDETGIKKVDTETRIVKETIVKYDSVIMNKADVEFFVELVQKGEINLNNQSTQSVEKSAHISKTLIDLIAKAIEDNKPLRIDFDNNISVIIKISRDGKITADFLPSSQIAEAYLKENLPLLRQKFEDNNIDYDSLNQRERKDKQKENNHKKGQNNE